MQEWNWRKRLEQYAKRILRCKPKSGLSCVEPSEYARRFLSRVVQLHFHCSNQTDDRARSYSICSSNLSSNQPDGSARSYSLCSMAKPSRPQSPEPTLTSEQFILDIPETAESSLLQVHAENTLEDEVYMHMQHCTYRHLSDFISDLA